MNAESLIYTALKDVVPGSHVYPVDLPATVTAATYVTYVQVGGDAVNFLDGGKPSKKNGRFQLNVWAPSDHEAAALARLVEDAMRTIPAQVLGASVSTTDPALDTYGRRQDFSVWFND